MLEGLDKIKWHKLEHAYGPADDVPGLIRDLTSEDSQRQVLSALAHSEKAWTHDNMKWLLQDLGLPSERSKLKQFLT